MTSGASAAMAQRWGHGRRGGRTLVRHASHDLSLEQTVPRVSGAGVAHAPRGEAAQRSSPYGRRRHCYTHQRRDGRRPPPIWLPCHSRDRAFLGTIAAGGTSPPSLTAQRGPGHGASGNRVETPTVRFGAPCLHLAAGTRGLNNGLAGRTRTVILRLDETIITETPPVSSCEGRRG